MSLPRLRDDHLNLRIDVGPIVRCVDGGQIERKINVNVVFKIVKVLACEQLRSVGSGVLLQ